MSRPHHTPKRTVRVENELWDAAHEVADERGDNLSAIIRGALLRYVKRHRQRKDGS